jgi:hypothetical protein
MQLNRKIKHLYKYYLQIYSLKNVRSLQEKETLKEELIKLRRTYFLRNK